MYKQMDDFKLLRFNSNVIPFTDKPAFQSDNDVNNFNFQCQYINVYLYLFTDLFHYLKFKQHF